MGLAGYGPVPEPGYYFEFYATLWVESRMKRGVEEGSIVVLISTRIMYPGTDVVV